jgi:hypothetical protein
LSLGRRFNTAVTRKRNPRVAERRLKAAKKRRSNVVTNSQQSQPSLRDWIIIRPSTGVKTKLNRHSATKKRLPGNAKDLGNDNPYGLATATFRTLI